MSTATEVNKGDNFLHTRFDRAKIFLGKNEYETGLLSNPTGGEKTYPAGTVIARDAATENFVVYDSGSAQADELIVFGILATSVTIPTVSTESVSVCKSGRVLENKVVFDNGTDLLSDVVNDRTIRDRILGDTGGIYLLLGQELTGQDNDL